MSYRNAWWCSDESLGGPCIKLSTWDSKGNRVRLTKPYSPYIYIEHPRGTYKSLFGTKLIKKEFEQPWDRSRYLKNKETKRIYENFDVTQQFLLDEYWDKVEDKDFTANPLRIIFFDIEVDPLPNGEFPKPDEAKAEINIITAYDSLVKKYYVFSKNDYNGEGLIKQAIFVKCKDEKELLQRFVDMWCDRDYPDIVAGWNSNGFDYPYTFNRIKKKLGDAQYYRLSPYGVINEREAVNDYGKKMIKYDVAGLTLLDYQEVYTVFKMVKQESYKLDFICNMELGIGKVDYQGCRTIYEFMEQHWDTFVEYNVRDVELIVKLDAKMRYLDVLKLSCYEACCNFNKGIATIPISNGALARRARERGVALPFFRGNDCDVKVGGFVSSKLGFHPSVTSYDAASLHPSSIRSCNMSPETKVGMCYFDFNRDVYDGDGSDMLTFIDVQKHERRINREQLWIFIKKFDLILAPNGCVFTQKVEGILAQFMRENFDKRSQVKKEMKSLQRENAELEEKLKDAKKSGDKELQKSIKNKIKENDYVIDQCDIRQANYKRLLNMTYGAINSRMNPLGDDDIGNAICSNGTRSIKALIDLGEKYSVMKRKEFLLSQPQTDEVVAELKEMESPDYEGLHTHVFTDTDSAGFDFSKIGIKMFDGFAVTPEGYALVDGADEYFSEEFPKWFEKTTNSHLCCLYFKREKICDAGLYLSQKDNADKEAKKNYVLHILDNEGVKHPKFKYTGVKFARSVMPANLKEMGKRIVENMMMTQDRQSTDIMINQLYKDYCEMPMSEKAETKRCNNMDKYSNLRVEEVRDGKTVKYLTYDNFGKKIVIPGHIRVAQNYNKVISEKGFSNLQEIKGGDVVKIVPVEKDNEWGIDKICFLDEWPLEFDNLFKIDNKTGFEKIIYEELRRYYQTMGWPAFNPTLNYEFSLFDILGI